MGLMQDGTQEPWRVEILGRLSLRRGDRVITRFRSPKVGLLLAYLSSYGQRTHLRDDLVVMLWPEASPNAIRNRLSQVLVWLRQLLEPEDAPDIAPGSVLLADRTEIRLNPAAFRVDVVDFETAMAQGSRADASIDERIGALEEALRLYNGDLLPGFYEDWVIAERRRLAEARTTALTALARLYRERGGSSDFAAAETYARQAIADDPTQEESHIELMRTLAAAGQDAAALRQYHELERLLAAHLDEKPSADAAAVARQIRERTASSFSVPEIGGIAPGASPASRDRPSTPPWANLPLPLTRFFGRETELAQAEQMLQQSGTRLVTLLGMGGSGKTRLAIELGRRLAAHYAGAVAFVALADLSDPGLIPTALVDALHLERSGAGGDPLEPIVTALAAMPGALLILDNMEHLVHGASPVLRALLERIPRLTILATSRQRLGVGGERALDISPLPLPDPDEASVERLLESPSVRLFVDRAQAVRPSFRLTPANAQAVMTLCAHLEGIPLAIELCAAWSEILTPAQLLKQLSDRFSLLVTHRDDLPDRHRTLRAAIEYSFALLPPDLKTAFVNLSVFRGGWTLEAAEAVLSASLPPGALDEGNTLDLLIRLRERSLIVAEESPAEDAMRYRMLETLREFGEAERATAASEGGDPIRRRHAEHFQGLAEAASPNLIGPDGPIWMARLEADHDNLRTALQWYQEAGEATDGMRLATSLSRFWDIRGYFQEGLGWLTEFLALSEREGGSSAAERAHALHAQSRLLYSLSDFEKAYMASQAALEQARAAGDAHQVVRSLYFLGSIGGRLGWIEEAQRSHEQSLAEARLLEDALSIGTNLTDLGNLYMREGRFAQARLLFEESLTVFRDASLLTNEGVVFNNLGLIARYEGDYERARELLQKALDAHQKSAFRLGYAIAQINFGALRRIQADYAEAGRRLSDALTIAWEVKSKHVAAWALKEMGNLWVAERRFARGVRFLAAAEALREELRLSFRPSDPEDLDRDSAAARAALGDAAFEAAWSAGQRVTLARIIEEALG